MSKELLCKKVWLFGGKNDWREVRAEVEDLKRAVREMQEEWERVHKRMTRAYRNNARTLADIEAVENPSDGGIRQPEEPGGLTPRQRGIQQSILRRRGGL